MFMKIHFTLLYQFGAKRVSILNPLIVVFCSYVLDILNADFQYLNLNSLLVTRQMTLFHQGVRMGEKLVP